jgi:hypothetical protein
MLLVLGVFIGEIKTHLTKQLIYFKQGLREH